MTNTDTNTEAVNHLVTEIQFEISVMAGFDRENLSPATKSGVRLATMIEDALVAAPTGEGIRMLTRTLVDLRGLNSSSSAGRRFAEGVTPGNLIEVRLNGTTWALMATAGGRSWPVGGGSLVRMTNGGTLVIHSSTSRAATVEGGVSRLPQAIEGRINDWDGQRNGAVPLAQVPALSWVRK